MALFKGAILLVQTVCHLPTPVTRPKTPAEGSHGSRATQEDCLVNCSVGLVPPSVGTRVDSVRGPPVFLLGGPEKRVCAWEPTTTLSVLNACKAICARDPVVSGKEGRAAAAVNWAQFHGY